MKAMIETESLESIWSTFREAFPGLLSLEDQRFVSDEVTYKREAALEASRLIGAVEMKRLVEEGAHAELTERVRKVCQRTNLLYLATPRTGDCNVLFASEDRGAEFWPQLNDLLHGDRPLLERFDAYLKLLEIRGLPNKWTFPTYLLFLLHPDQAIFVKPRRVAQLLEVLDRNLVLDTKPSAEQYGRILELGRALLDYLRPHGAVDFIDIQSVFWVWSQEANRKVESNREWQKLIDRFKAKYLDDEVGRMHLEDYQKAQVEALGNWKKLQSDRASGHLDWKDVFRLTLPHRKTGQNQKSGHWIHPDSFASGPVLQLLLSKGSIDESELPGKAGALLDFYERVLANPDALQKAAEEFQASPLSKGLQSGMLSPWLSAVAPDHFLVDNSKSRKVISHFSGIPLEESLAEYGRVNEEGLRLIDDHPELGKLAPGYHPHLVFDAFCHWMVAVEKYFQKTVPAVATGWWVMKITPNDATRTSDLCDALFGEGKPNVIGWDTGVHSDEGKNPLFRQWFDDAMDIEDRIIVMEGRRLVHAVVEVTGEEYNTEQTDSVLWFRCRRPVRLIHRFHPPLKTKSQTSIWTLVPANRKELTTYQVAEQVKNALLEVKGNGPVPPTGNALFNPRAFELLALLDKTPTRECYQQYRDAFQRFLEEPLKLLFNQLADSLDDRMSNHLETRKGVFSRIPKNDYGQGGAWPHIWAAFYPLGSKRIADAQLFLSLSSKGIEAGFYIGEYGKSALDRLQLNLSRLSPQLDKLLNERFAGSDLHFGSVEPGTAVKDFTAWKAEPDGLHPRVAMSIPAKKAETMTLGELKSTLERLYEQIWPLFLLAVSDNPWPLIGVTMEGDTPVELQPAYDIDTFGKETGVPKQRAEEWLGILERKKQIVLQGPPGTGKTFIAQRLARMKTSEKSGFWESVQFHPSYSYEDFMEGLRPCELTQGFTYKLFPGRFLEFCERATAAGDDPCVLILDEINRAPLSRVFGELMYALEYRDSAIRLAYSGRPFKIPNNVYLIGTMNTADRSIALVDHALRRRFSFISLGVDYDVLRNYLTAGGMSNAAAFVELLKKVNAAVGDDNFSVGISYFMKPGVELKQHIGAIWQGEIEPYLDELFYGQSKQVKYKWRDLREQIVGFF